MKSTTRRDVLKGLACGSLIVGFDPLTRSWVTSANAAGATKTGPRAAPGRRAAHGRRSVERRIAVKLSRSDWRQHYGHDFDELARAKHRYDSKNVLASGPDLFQVKSSSELNLN